MSESQTIHDYKDFKVKQDISGFKEITELKEKSGFVLMYFDQRIPFNSMKLSADSEKLKTTPNLGGSSELSEALSFEMLHRCFDATLVETESKIKYIVEGKAKTDFVVSMFGLFIAVSVTRAFKYDNDTDNNTYTIRDAKKLLDKKLKKVNISSENSVEPWHKQGCISGPGLTA